MNDRELLIALAKEVRDACIKKCTEVGERTDMLRIDMAAVVGNFMARRSIDTCHICGFSRNRVGGAFCSVPHAVSYPDYVKGRAEFAIEQLESLLAVVDSYCSYRPDQIRRMLNERIEAIRSRSTETLGPGAAS